MQLSLKSGPKCQRETQSCKLNNEDTSAGPSSASSQSCPCGLVTRPLLPVPWLWPALACSVHPEQEKAGLITPVVLVPWPVSLRGQAPSVPLSSPYPLHLPGPWCKVEAPSYLRKQRLGQTEVAHRAVGRVQDHASALWVLGKLGFFKSEDRCSELGAG